jgi:cell division protein FtsZ
MVNRESLNDILHELGGANLVFVIAGLGGGSDTGSAPVITEAVREIGALTLSCVTLPFDSEIVRRKKAVSGIKSLAEKSDSVVVSDTQS